MQKRKKHITLKIFSAFLIITAIAVIFISVFYIYVDKNIDFTVDETLFLQSKSGNITRFYYNASDGEEYVPKELSSIEPVGNRKSWYSFDEIGDNLKNAFIAAEDRHFYEHNGIDKKRTAFAVLNYFLHIKPKFGGSSITQQVIKNISGDNDSTPKRKINEMIRAVHIEYSHSKEEIFEVYMNVIPMGEKISGVGLAANTYFGKNPDELSLAEAAAIVGIANAPTKYNPYANLDACVKKRNAVLFSMLDFGIISEEQYKQAIEEKITLIPYSNDINRINSWFIETVCDDIVNDLVKQKGISENVARMLILNGGLSVYTTEKPQIQRIVEEYFENHALFPESVNDGLDYSMVITDSRTGNLLAIVGSVGQKSANRILNNALTLNPPGSALKPLALYAPVLNAKMANWATVFDDVPISFKETQTGIYTMYPQNYPKKYDGLTTLSHALCVSKNTVAVRIYNLLGKRKIFDILEKDYGFDTIVRSKKLSDGKIISDLDISPLALGQLSYGVSLRKLTEAYTVFPNEGVLNKGRSYVAVYDSDGKLILDNPRVEKEVLTSETARIMNQMLSLVVKSGTAKIINLKNTVDTAGKTGTSGNDKNRFFIGYTPYFTAGIRCGYSDNRSIGYQSVSHIEIWDNIMQIIHESALKNEDNILSFSTEGLEYLPYCMDSGGLFGVECMHDLRGNRLEYGYFTLDNKPMDYCDRHVFCLYDISTGEILKEGFENENTILISLLNIADRNFPCKVSVNDSKYILNDEIIIKEEQDAFQPFIPEYDEKCRKDERKRV